MKVMKRILAAVLSIVMCFSMAGCYNQDLSWSVQDGDEQVAIGIYLYYLYVAFDDAADLVPQDEEVLKATIEGVPAEEWIRNKALDYVKCYLWMDDMITQYNLELTEDEIESAESTTAYLEQNTGAAFDELGISTSSFTKAYGEYNIKFRKLFDYYYGEGGEREIPKETLQEEYCKDQYYYSYTYVPITTTDADGNTVDIPADERAEIEDTMAYYAKQLQSGATDIDSVASALALLTGSEPNSVTDVTDFMYENFTTEFIENVKDMEDYEIRVFESQEQLILLYKFAIEDAFEMIYEDNADRLDVMLELKSAEFTDYVLEQASAAKTDITVNDKAINSVKLKNIVTEETKMGLLEE